MDLYLFYNCINNIIEVSQTPENKLTLRHQIMVNDPLVFNFYLKNLNIKTPQFLSGGANPEAKPAKVKKDKNTDAQSQLLQLQLKEAKRKENENKENQKKKKEAIKAEEKKKKEEEAEEQKKEEKEQDNADEEAINKAQEDSENSGELDGLKNFLKSISKIIVGFFVILMMPIIPFFMVTFYSLKNLGVFFEINMNRL